MKRIVPILLCLAIVTVFMLGAGCGETATEEEVIIYGNPVEGEDVLPDDINEMWERASLLDRSQKPGEDAEFIGDNWEVRTSHYLGDFDWYLEALDDEDNVIEGEWEYDRTDVSYLALATYEVEADDNLRLKAGVVRRNEYKDSDDESTGGGFREFDATEGQVVNPDGDPVKVVTETKNLGNELWECSETGTDYLTVHRYRFVIGWVNQPEVSEFTVQFSDGRSVTLDAEKHQFFVGILD